jgi:hypothetical protein
VTAVADLALELARRNARLRAWRGMGVPVRGGWNHSLFVPRQAFLAAGCESCDANVGGNVHAGERWTAGYTRGRLKAVERREFDRLRRLGCPHLAPLLLPDPPELAALYELELLAGA